MYLYIIILYFCRSRFVVVYGIRRTYGSVYIVLIHEIVWNSIWLAIAAILLRKSQWRAPNFVYVIIQTLIIIILSKTVKKKNVQKINYSYRSYLLRRDTTTDILDMI